jgi:adenylyltransferase/sulfurtransferase
MSQPEWIITVDQLRTELASKNAPKLVDVREQEEYDESRIEGCTLIPLGELEARAPSELSKEDNIVAYCHVGGRSLHAVMVLKALGFKQVRSLEGGIVAWEETP